MVGIEKLGKPDDKFQYNAQSEKEESIGIYETPFRGYDAQLGIFRQVDALAGLFSGISPYQFAYNNPIYFNDPTGLAAVAPSKTSGNDDPLRTHSSINSTYYPLKGVESSLGLSQFKPQMPQSQSMGKGLPDKLPSPQQGGSTVIKEVAKRNRWISILGRLGSKILGVLAMVLEPSEMGTEDIPAPLSENQMNELLERQRDREEERKKYVTIYKAPSNKENAQKQLMMGYQPIDFPRNAYADGAAYFAAPNSRKVAEHWNRQYGAGIIEITIPLKDYELYFKPRYFIGRYEMGQHLYPGADASMGVNPQEVRIPKEKFLLLNKYPRIIKPF